MQKSSENAKIDVFIGNFVPLESYLHYLLLLALIACTTTDYQSFQECKQQEVCLHSLTLACTLIFAYMQFLYGLCNFYAD